MILDAPAGLRLARGLQTLMGSLHEPVGVQAAPARTPRGDEFNVVQNRLALAMERARVGEDR